ncbi:YsnF/AvaK domain-containing protein [Chimaeribacter arupi]|nr:YsnF/AvaK domain-containing protein [Chimaeribacter arupi]
MMIRKPTHAKEEASQESREVQEALIPLAQEQVDVSKEKVIKGRVTVTRKTVLHEQPIDELLHKEHVEVQRIPKGERVDVIPAIREENGVTIIPVVEEEIEVIRRLVLKEELHIKKVTTQQPFQDSVTLRSQEVSIERQEDDKK